MSTIIFNPRNRFGNPYGFTTQRSQVNNQGETEVKPQTKKAPTNILEKADQYVIQLAIPGYTKTEVSISIDNNKLTIKGAKENTEATTYRSKEFGVTAFENSFTLGDNVDTNAIVAAVENGVLNVTIAKTPEKQPVQITIQ